MASAADGLISRGIRLRAYSPGEHTTTCPQCSHLRKPANRRKPCLSVLIGPGQTKSGALSGDEAVWCCHHCGWAGGLSERHERQAMDRAARKAREPAQKQRRGWW